MQHLEKTVTNEYLIPMGSHSPHCKYIKSNLRTITTLSLVGCCYLLLSYWNDFHKEYISLNLIAVVKHNY